MHTTWGVYWGSLAQGLLWERVTQRKCQKETGAREPFLFFFFFFNVFMYFYCAEPSLLSRLFFSCHVRASQSGDFSCCGARALGHPGFRSCSPQALEHRPSHCGTEASLFCTVWDPPGSGIKSTSPVMAGGFFTTEPPGKPHFCFILFCFCCHSVHLGADTWSMFVARRSQEVGCQRKQMLRVWDIHSIGGKIILELGLKPWTITVPI